MSTPQEALAEALAAVQRTSTLAAQRTTALAEMQRERGEARADAVTNGKAAERLSGELAEARRTIQLLRAALDDRPLDPEGFGRLRAALDEERIEPGWWCRVHNATFGACDVSNGIPCAAAYGRTEGEAG